MRRAANWALAVLVGLAAVVGLIALLNARDDSEITSGAGRGADAGPGRIYRGEPVLSPALEDAVKRGNVVVLHRDDEPPEGIDELVPPGGQVLEEAGQAVIVEREPTLNAPLAALSERRIQRADTPAQLQPFIDYWLGGR